MYSSKAVFSGTLGDLKKVIESDVRKQLVGENETMKIWMAAAGALLKDCTTGPIYRGTVEGLRELMAWETFLKSEPVVTPRTIREQKIKEFVCDAIANPFPRTMQELAVSTLSSAMLNEIFPGPPNPWIAAARLGLSAAFNGWKYHTDWRLSAELSVYNPKEETAYNPTEESE